MSILTCINFLRYCIIASSTRVTRCIIIIMFLHIFATIFFVTLPFRISIVFKSNINILYSCIISWNVRMVTCMDVQRGRKHLNSEVAYWLADKLRSSSHATCGLLSGSEPYYLCLSACSSRKFMWSDVHSEALWDT